MKKIDNRKSSLLICSLALVGLFASEISFGETLHVKARNYDGSLKSAKITCGKNTQQLPLNGELVTLSDVKLKSQCKFDYAEGNRHTPRTKFIDIDRDTVCYMLDSPNNGFSYEPRQSVCKNFY